MTRKIVSTIKFTKNYTSSSVRNIGKSIKSLESNDTEYARVMAELEEWRSIHMAIINKCQEIGVTTASRVGNTVVTARLKRMPTILNKLRRYPKMNLARMQDIAGVRLICQTVDEVYEITRHIINKFGPLNCKVDDYINNPKQSGYRCIHIRTKYDVISDNGEFRAKNLWVEFQIRTAIEHLWATTIETLDVLRDTDMKSGGSDPEWEDFFRLISKVFETIECKDSNYNLIDLLKEIQEKHDGVISLIKILSEEVFSQKQGVGYDKNDKYAIVKLNKVKRKISVRYFEDEEGAVRAYNDTEEKSGNGNVVLVTAATIDELRKRYPNYFGSLSLFNIILNKLFEVNYERV